MAIGINADELTKLKINFLDLSEELKKISSILSKDFEDIKNNLNCSFSADIGIKASMISDSLGTINFNLNKYLDDIDKVIKAYKSQDDELSLKIKSDIQKVEGSEF